MADPVFNTMAVLALVCGLRLRELRSLRWSDIHFDQACLRLGARQFPLTRPLLQALFEQPKLGPWVFSLDGNQLTHGACKWPLYRIATRAGLERIGWDVLRNTFDAIALRSLAMQRLLLEPREPWSHGGT